MLELVNITKDYYVDKQAYPALKGINLYFPKQQFCSILGPSGCGKTTTLNIIGGLDKYTTGDLIIEGQSTKNYHDYEWDNYRNKKIGFVFQSYNLISHLTILENVAMSLTLQGTKRKEKIQRAKAALDAVGLKDLYNKKPNQLSGGQQQRVAIARAIINDPEIILADEPTGALDSTTSVQIMEILKEISKNKLIIMVTHNRELALKYSDRIIEFKDGEVESDSFSDKIAKIKAEEDAQYDVINKTNLKDFEIIDEKDRAQKKKLKKKEKMSHMSFFSALKNSFKNLLTKKGRTIMTSIASSFGIIGVALVLSVNNGFGLYMDRIETETASQMPLTISSYSVTFEIDDSFVPNPEYSESTDILPYKSNTGVQKVTYNNINEKYINFLNKIKTETDLMNDYLISYGDTYDMNFTTTDPVTNEPYIMKNGTVNTVMNMVGSLTGLPTTYFHSLYGEKEFILNAYDVIAGEYPNTDDMTEMVLVVDSRNQINLTCLKQLGFYQRSSEVTVDYATEHPIKFETVIGKKYKVFTNQELYSEHVDNTVENQPNGIYHYTTENLEEYYNDDSKGINLKIVGVLRPKQNSSVATMTTGLCFQNSLQNYLLGENRKADIYNKILNNISFDETKNPTDLINDLTGLISVETDENGNSSTTINVNNINSIFDNYYHFYDLFTGSNTTTSGSEFTIKNYLKQANIIGADVINKELKEGGAATLLKYIEKICGYMVKGTVDKQELAKSYPYVLSFLGYINSYSNIQNIVIFPSSLNAKNELIAKLDEYNEIDETETSPDHAWNKKEQIFYTDLVGELTSSLSQMIDIISVVLIVFAGISLVVSCVMTGVITFASVVERTKEIGVLRALGARKKDVGLLFQAECVITGFVSGLIGCLVAYLITFPINFIINSLYAEYNIGNIASLAWHSVIILIVISILLTFISSLFPSRAAARKDPVIALRTE